MGFSTINEKIFKNTVFLIIELAGELGIGAIKLNKCLIIIDALHKAFYNESLTEAKYIKHDHGPVPGKEGHGIIQELIRSGDIVVKNEMVSPGKYEHTHRLHAEVKVSRTMFSKEDLDIISWTVSTVMKMTAREISEISHDKYYHNTKKFDEIDLANICKWEIFDEQEKISNSEKGDSSEIYF